MSWIRSWKNNQKKYNWKYIHRACDSIVRSYDHNPPDKIIGLSRGGWVPAVILANLMGVREVLSMGVASYDGNKQGEMRMYQRLPVNCPVLNNRQRVLIVDDISDKGDTLKHVIDNISTTYNVIVETATVFYKPRTNHKPDYYHKMVPDDQWVVFPWEI